MSHIDVRVKGYYLIFYQCVALAKQGDPSVHVFVDLFDDYQSKDLFICKVVLRVLYLFNRLWSYQYNFWDAVD